MSAVTYRLYDMHCHLDRMANADALIAEAAAHGLAAFCVPVTPGESEDAAVRFAGLANVRVGAGFHPWWVDKGMPGSQGEPGIMSSRSDAGRRRGFEAELACVVELASTARFIGEVGLDFGRAHVVSRAEQVSVFERIVRACAEHPLDGRVLSIHAVRSADTVMDVLEAVRLTKQAVCIFHWFSGTSAELARARRFGCFFSINEMMLSTKKGREYARIIPEERLLLETDAPPTLDAPYTVDVWERSLNTVLDELAAIRDSDRQLMSARIAETSARLFG